jgi:BirA family biotin operon repressor/biotin-[acetyl-CoA-carboxylase] ligase
MSSYSAKMRILVKLTESLNEYLSGEQLGRELGMSRAAVWKHIRDLRRMGHEIEASTKNGYRLIGKTDIIADIISEGLIKSGLTGTIFDSNIIYKQSVGSTNTAAYIMAQEGAPEGTVVIADSQSAGKGRMGRSWQSPPGKGIWMSFILRPDLSANDMQTVTLAASVSVAKTLEQLTGIKPGIKWPNDIILDGRKVCGILTEMNSEIDRVNYIIVGIGLNFSQQEDDFDGNIRDTAISLAMHLKKNGIKLKNNMRNDIIKEILKIFDYYYGLMLNSDKAAVIRDWRNYSVTLGSSIKVHSRNGEFCGLAEDITEDGALVIKAEDGGIRIVTSGEVSIRGIMGCK